MYHSIGRLKCPPFEQISSQFAFKHSEFLNSLNISGLPPHKLTLKIGMVLILLRSISQTLCNGTRLILRGFGNSYLKAEVATGDQVGKIVFIPRIPICPSSPPINFKRR
ncbi:TPA: hypothetical protein N0F65_006558 [Lagenidium giganteum]|uniref:DNA helicase Pif1-like 2B domain-containing protein n=1 Tax=Lagenidium giganteum TaxID=4803 RepID=A0AAV2YMW5_9STRA|nr:TPA: hypothetical protein N0F65_006558 [Lagenidium giganteum]